MKKIARRKIIKNAAALSLAQPLLSSFGLWPWISDKEKKRIVDNFFLGSAHAQVPPPPGAVSRLLVITLPGGACSILGPDPFTDQKMFVGGQLNNGYDVSWRNITNRVNVVTGKTLAVGPGLAPAIPAFAALPTAIVNGIYIPVSSHGIADDYMQSGLQSISNTREYAAVAAQVGTNTTHFPPHIVLGGRVPLADTRRKPPVISNDFGNLGAQLSGPYNRSGTDQLSSQSIQTASTLTQTLNQQFESALPQRDRAASGVWNAMSQQVNDLFAREFYKTIAPSNELRARYYPNSGTGSPQALIAAAYLSLANDLTRVATVSYQGGFDTHSNHLASHTPALQRFATVLNTLVQDMINTPEPTDPTVSLASTTTIVVMTEFGRTPIFNGNRGADHWRSAWAVMMGAGVRDGAVIGATDDRGSALGWENGQSIAFDEDHNALKPEHVAAAILRRYNLTEASTQIMATNPVFDQLFTGSIG